MIACAGKYGRLLYYAAVLLCKFIFVESHCGVTLVYNQDAWLQLPENFFSHRLHIIRCIRLFRQVLVNSPAFIFIKAEHQLTVPGKFAQQSKRCQGFIFAAAAAVREINKEQAWVDCAAKRQHFLQQAFPDTRACN